MSRSGQKRFPQRPVAVFALDLEQGASTGRHAHPFGQLVHAAQGVMRVLTPRGSWVVPPGRAVWIPTALEHEVQMVTSVAMRTVYVVPEALQRAPREPRVVEVTALLRELILEALRRPRPYPLGGADERLFQVLLDCFSFREVVPLHLPSPKSDYLKALAARLQRDPADKRPIDALAKGTGASARTLARDFRRETGLSFGAWRAQMRLMRALELLAQGERVTEVALALGYESSSAFIHAFRRSLGTTPARYFSASKA
jgi:AraC-like DNA-binding protein/quercetin dioxygenase-like cupin family protein